MQTKIPSLAERQEANRVIGLNVMKSVLEYSEKHKELQNKISELMKERRKETDSKRKVVLGAEIKKLSEKSIKLLNNQLNYIITKMGKWGIRENDHHNNLIKINHGEYPIHWN